MSPIHDKPAIINKPPVKTNTTVPENKTPTPPPSNSTVTPSGNKLEASSGDSVNSTVPSTGGR